jgi:release factor glutamine methyltransferase
VLPADGRALDVCTGSGAVAAHLGAEVPTATVIGSDCDMRAAACARRNGVLVIVAELAACVHPQPRLDVVTAVAPYVPSAAIEFLPRDVRHYEPRLALDGGDDGLDLVRRVVAVAGQRLRVGGWLLVEVAADQDRMLAEPLERNGFDEIETWRDDDGDLRGIAARLAG